MGIWSSRLVLPRCCVAYGKTHPGAVSISKPWSFSTNCEIFRSIVPLSTQNLSIQNVEFWWVETPDERMLSFLTY